MNPRPLRWVFRSRWSRTTLPHKHTLVSLSARAHCAGRALPLRCVPSSVACWCTRSSATAVGQLHPWQLWHHLPPQLHHRRRRRTTARLRRITTRRQWLHSQRARRQRLHRQRARLHLHARWPHPRLRPRPHPRRISACRQRLHRQRARLLLRARWLNPHRRPRLRQRPAHRKLRGRGRARRRLRACQCRTSPGTTRCGATTRRPMLPCRCRRACRSAMTCLRHVASPTAAQTFAASGLD